jgi:hypothetical protein
VESETMNNQYSCVCEETLLSGAWKVHIKNMVVYLRLIAAGNKKPSFSRGIYDSHISSASTPRHTRLHDLFTSSKANSIPLTSACWLHTGSMHV